MSFALIPSKDPFYNDLILSRSLEFISHAEMLPSKLINTNPKDTA